LDAFYIDENELPPGISTSIGNFQVCCLTLYNLFLQTSARFCQD
jgi:hypothetical protein